MAGKTADKEVWRFASEQTEKRLKSLTAGIDRVVKSHDADAVHDLRVAIRRVTQALHVFKSSFHHKAPRRIHRKLKQIMTLAGDVRNCDIALKLLAKSKKAGGGNATARLRSRRRENLRALIALLINFQGKKLPDKWRTELVTAAEESAGSSRESVNEAARRLLTPVADKFFKLGQRAAMAKAPADELHRFRIAAKKFRYSLELFIPLYGPSLNSLLGQIVHAQELLGDINDCETVRKMISSSKGAGSAGEWLKTRQHKRTAAFRNYWNRVFEADAKKREWPSKLR